MTAFFKGGTMKQLNYDEKAMAINEAMRFESEGYSDYEYLKRCLKLELSRNREQYMAFLRNGTPMMQKMYLELSARKPIHSIRRFAKEIIRGAASIACIGAVSVVMAFVVAEWIGGNGV